MKLMLDSNIFDKLCVDSTTADLLQSLKIDGRIETFITSVQLNELNNITDPAKKDCVHSVLHRLSPVKLFVELAPYGYAYGECYGGRSPDSVLDDKKFITSDRHVHDAMIAATASSTKYNLDYIVSEDEPFKRKLHSQSVFTKVINYSELLDKLRIWAT